MKYLAGAIALTIVVTAVAIFSRPILPIDETRYVSVAWEGYATGDLLVSHKNGETYAHKPPLLFWLINACWTVFGVSEFAARIVAPLAGLLCLPLVRWIARQLWPDDPRVANFAPIILASFSVWLLFAPLTMFDTLLTLSALIAISGLMLVTRTGRFWGWAVMGIGMGLGILTKGPVIFVSTLPLSLLAFWWRPSNKICDERSSSTTNERANSPSNNQAKKWSHDWRWYAGVVVAILIAGAIGLSWAIPSAMAGGENYANELLWGQTAGRVTKSFSHRHPFYWYLPILPLCLLPWLFLGTVWRGARMLKWDWQARFLACWIMAPLFFFSLISGKQVHYLMPLFPAFALLIARAVSLVQQPIARRDVLPLAVGTGFLSLIPLALNFIPQLALLGLANIVPTYIVPMLMLVAVGIFVVGRHSVDRVVLGVATCSSAAICMIIAAGAIHFWRGFSVDELARYVADSDQPVVWYGEYHAQLNFAGRLQCIDAALTAEQLDSWMDSHASGIVVTRLVGEGQLWKDFLATEGTQSSPQPTEIQQRMLAEVLSQKAEFANLKHRPTVDSVYWIRLGLLKKPYVAISIQSESSANVAIGVSETRR